MTLAVISEWSDMKSALETLMLVMSVVLLVASTSSKFDAPEMQRVGLAMSCRRPRDSRPSACCRAAHMLLFNVFSYVPEM